MASQNWVSLLNPDIAGASGPGATLTLAASTQIASPVWAGASGIDVAQVFGPGQPLGWRVPLLVRVTARGYFTSTSTTGTLTVFLRALKNNVSSTYVTLATTAGITTPSSAITGMQWKLEALCRCTGIAASGNTVSTQGEFTIVNNATAPTINVAAGSLVNGVTLTAGLPSITGETAAAVDTTVNQGIELAVTGTAAQGTFVCTQWLVEALN